jgi:dolichol-phosphate mannosyltransferase
MDLSIIIPCYNEVDNVGKLEAELLPVVKELASARSVELVMVDDGSTDGTLDALEQALLGHPDLEDVALRFERHPANMGLGAAIRTGFKAASGQTIVTTDSDGTYKFRNIPALLSNLETGVDIVTASPYHPAGEVVGVPGYRLILSQGSSMIYRVLVDWRIHTYTCLFRAYRRKVIEDISFESNGFLAGTELMVKAMLRGYKVVEFPAVLYSRAYGVSKAKIMRTIRAHLGFQWRVFLHRLNFSKLVSHNARGG